MSWKVSRSIVVAEIQSNKAKIQLNVADLSENWKNAADKETEHTSVVDWISYKIETFQCIFNLNTRYSLRTII